ncbi:MAG: TolC family protein [Bacteroidetes bacterium]|nr:TolC family protein [Bacteroidota bacterium]
MGRQIVIIFFLVAGCGLCTAQTTFLQQYINNGLRNSPLLKEYQNQVALNKYDSLLIIATTKPQVTGSSFNSYAPVIKGFGYDGAITNGANIITLVGVNKSIPNKKLLNAQFENLQLQSQERMNTSKLTEQDLKRGIIAQYIAAYGSLLQLNFNKDIENLLAKEEVVLKKLTQTNVYKQSDYLAFLVTLQQQQLLVKQSTIQYKNDFATLNYLCGITDTATTDLQDPGITLHTLPETKTSVFFKQFEIDSLKIINNKTLVTVSYKPKINVFADAGYNSSLAFQAYKNFGTSFGISASIPIYDGRQKKLQYSKIDVEEKTRQNYQSYFTTQYQQQIAQLTQQLKATESLISDINSQLKYTQSLIDVNGKLLETGEARITDYVLALNNYINAQNLVTQNNIARLQIINQLNYWNR